jgi:hypothetical protein
MALVRAHLFISRFEIELCLRWAAPRRSQGRRLVLPNRGLRQRENRNMDLGLNSSRFLNLIVETLKPSKPRNLAL